jgi:hypothetical protein
MTLPVLCGELAPWFHVLTSPGRYEDEAAAILALLRVSLAHSQRREWPGWTGTRAAAMMGRTRALEGGDEPAQARPFQRPAG